MRLPQGRFGVPAVAFWALLQGSAPAVPESEPAPVRGADLDLLQEVRTIASRVEGVRGVRLVSPPVAVRASDESRRTVVEGRMTAAFAEGRLAARGRAWADLGLDDPTTPARVVRSLLADLDGASYDVAERRLLVDPGRLSESDFRPAEGGTAATSMLLATGLRPDEPLLAHLLVHALHHQRTASDALPESTDALIADAAWAEGEANLVAMLYLFQSMGLQKEVVLRSLDPGEVLGGALLPTSLHTLPPPARTFVDFVYGDGFSQTLARFTAGGWAAVEEAAASRRTSRDVLHLDRAPLRAVVLDDPSIPQGLKLEDRDSLGELGAVAVVSTLTGKDNLGLQAGDGWVADALFRFEPPPGGPSAYGVTLWITRWETPADSADFEYALTRGLSEKHAGKAFIDAGPRERVLAAGDRIYRVTRSEAEVRVQVATASFDRPLAPSSPRPTAKKTATAPK